MVGYQCVPVAVITDEWVGASSELIDVEGSEFWTARCIDGW